MSKESFSIVFQTIKNVPFESLTGAKKSRGADELHLNLLGSIPDII